MTSRTVRRTVIAALSALALAAGCARKETPKSALTSRPNVLVLLIDCMRADHLAAYGAGRAYAPHLDALAASGVVFRDAFSVASWTRPSVPSLFTGLYPSEHGITDSFGRGRRQRAKRRLADEAQTIAESFRAAGYRTAALGEQAQLSRTFKLDQGFDDYRVNLGPASKIDSEFLAWLDRDRSKPFFAYLHFLDVHWPYCPGAAFGRFDSSPGTLSFCTGEGKADQRFLGSKSPSPSDLVALRARYAEQLYELDHELGGLFAELRKRGVWEELTVVLVADHGEELWEHGGLRHGHTLYDELLRVPFVWKLPESWGRSAGLVLPGLVESRSLAPTLMEIAGRPAPAYVSAPSLLGWMRGGESRAVRQVFAESNGMYAARTADWKLISTPEKKRLELFGLAADPGEHRNLAAVDAAHVAEMQSLLRQWRQGLKPLRSEEASEVDQETVEGLRALGYLDTPKDDDR